MIEYGEFYEMLATLLHSRNLEDLSRDRVTRFWTEIDQDQSGEVDFEEFLVWYQQVVKSNALNPESFYATFGVKRMSRNAKVAANSAASPADSVKTGE